MIAIWQVGNTGVRNPMRIHEAFRLYAESNLVGKIRGVDGAVAFTNYLCEKGILNNAPGRDPTGSYGRKWRFVFNLNGFTYGEADGGDFLQSDRRSKRHVTDRSWYVNVWVSHRDTG